MLGEGKWMDWGGGCGREPLSQAAILNCRSNNADATGARGLAEVGCCLNETTPSS